MRKFLSAIVIALSAYIALALLIHAAELSGGASGGGATQGGCGAPGSGVGLPGSIMADTTANGIGEGDTLGGAWVHGDRPASALSGAGTIASSSDVLNSSAFYISQVTGTGASLTSYAGAGETNLGAKTLTITNAASGSVDGVIADGGIGGGTGGGFALSGRRLALTGANTYTGATTINGGTLVAANATSLGTVAAGTTVASGANLTIANVAIGAEAVTLNGGTALCAVGVRKMWSPKYPASPLPGCRFRWEATSAREKTKVGLGLELCVIDHASNEGETVMTLARLNGYRNNAYVCLRAALPSPISENAPRRARS